MRCRRTDLTPCPESTAEEEWTKHPMEWPMEGGIFTGSKEAKRRVHLASLQGMPEGGGQGDAGDTSKGQEAAQGTPQPA